MLCFVTTQDFFVGDISKQQLCCYSTLGKDILTPLYFFLRWQHSIFRTIFFCILEYWPGQAESLLDEL